MSYFVVIGIIFFRILYFVIFLLMFIGIMLNKFLNYSYFLGLNNIIKFSKSNIFVEIFNYIVCFMFVSVC